MGGLDPPEKGNQLEQGKQLESALLSALQKDSALDIFNKGNKKGKENKSEPLSSPQADRGLDPERTFNNHEIFQ